MTTTRNISDESHAAPRGGEPGGPGRGRAPDGGHQSNEDDRKPGDAGVDTPGGGDNKGTTRTHTHGTDAPRRVKPLKPYAPREQGLWPPRPQAPAENSRRV